MSSFDVVVIGAGHNGLICACYLQKLGYRTLVLERREIVGGAVCTEEIFPGCKIDVGSSVHLMIHRTPIVADLELEKFGLDYLEMDPWASLPLGGGRALKFHRSLEKTCESIAEISPRDAAAYRDFVGRWTPVVRGVFDAFQKPPTTANFGRHVMFAKSPGKNSVDTLRQIVSGYGRLIDETFESVEMRAAMNWLAAQSGPPPTEPGTAPFAAWYAAVHETGAKRARGGSGMLTVALRNAFEAHGGQVLTNAPVEKILMENGRAAGVAVGGQSYFARAIVAACHVKTTFALLPENSVSDELKTRVSALNIGNGFGMTVRGVADALPDYGGGFPSDIHHGMQLLCPTPEFLRDAFGDYAAGRPSEKPPVLAMTFSAIDDSLAPPGKHIVQLWAQYFPYKRRDGLSWDDDAVRNAAADSICETLYAYAPNMRGAFTQKFIQTPRDLERRLGLLNGNVMHLEMSLDQMFGFRPLPELSEYKTPIDGLFLTGASTHPGGGVFGASGRSAAQVVARTIRRKR